MNMLDNYLDNATTNGIGSVYKIHEVDFKKDDMLLVRNIAFANHIDTLLSTHMSYTITDRTGTLDMYLGTLSPINLPVVSSIRYIRQDNDKFEAEFSIPSTQYKIPFLCDSVYITESDVEFLCDSSVVLAIHGNTPIKSVYTPHCTDIHLKFTVVSKEWCNLGDIINKHNTIRKAMGDGDDIISTVYSLNSSDKDVFKADAEDTWCLPRLPIATSQGVLTIGGNNKSQLCYENGQRITMLPDRSLLYRNGNNLAIVGLESNVIIIISNFIEGIDSDGMLTNVDMSLLK